MQCSQCDKPNYSKGYCKSCYDKWYRTTNSGRNSRTKAILKNSQTEHRKAYRKEYQEIYKVKRNSNRNAKRKIDIQYKLQENLRCRIRAAMRSQNQRKNSKSAELLGCSYDELRKHLESLFQPDMTWENYGRKSGLRCWEIDHIYPISKFDLSNSEEIKKACHYTNLQPLWADENTKKSNKI